MVEITEKEKAACGLLYNAMHDKELIEERAYCKALCYEYICFIQQKLGKGQI